MLRPTGAGRHARHGGGVGSVDSWWRWPARAVQRPSPQPRQQPQTQQPRSRVRPCKKPTMEVVARQAKVGTPSAMRALRSGRRNVQHRLWPRRKTAFRDGAGIGKTRLVRTAPQKRSAVCPQAACARQTSWPGARVAWPGWHRPTMARLAHLPATSPGRPRRRAWIKTIHRSCQTVLSPSGAAIGVLWPAIHVPTATAIASFCRVPAWRRSKVARPASCRKRTASASPHLRARQVLCPPTNRWPPTRCRNA